MLGKCTISSLMHCAILKGTAVIPSERGSDEERNSEMRNIARMRGCGLGSHDGGGRGQRSGLRPSENQLR